MTPLFPSSSILFEATRELVPCELADTIADVDALEFYLYLMRECDSTRIPQLPGPVEMLPRLVPEFNHGRLS